MVNEGEDVEGRPQTGPTTVFTADSAASTPGRSGSVWSLARPQSTNVAHSFVAHVQASAFALTCRCRTCRCYARYRRRAGAPGDRALPPTGVYERRVVAKQRTPWATVQHVEPPVLRPPRPRRWHTLGVTNDIPYVPVPAASPCFSSSSCGSRVELYGSSRSALATYPVGDGRFAKSYRVGERQRRFAKGPRLLFLVNQIGWDDANFFFFLLIWTHGMHTLWRRFFEWTVVISGTTWIP